MDATKMKTLVEYSVADILGIEGLAFIVLDFLCFRDLYILANCCSKVMHTSIIVGINPKTVTKLLNRCLIRQLKLHLFEFKLPCYNFLVALGNMNAVIAGGFALALFTGELHHESDIDIYVPTNKKKGHLHNVKSSGLNLLLKMEKYKRVKKCTNDNYRYYPQGFREYENININKKIQVLYHDMNRSNKKHRCIGDSVVSDYDFTTVMCYVQLTKRGMTFCCKNLNDAVNKTIKINVDCSKLQNASQFQMSCLPRLLKYHDRGFVVCNSITKYLPLLHELIKRQNNEDEQV